MKSKRKTQKRRTIRRKRGGDKASDIIQAARTRRNWSRGVFRKKPDEQRIYESHKFLARDLVKFYFYLYGEIPYQFTEQELDMMIEDMKNRDYPAQTIALIKGLRNDPNQSAIKIVNYILQTKNETRDKSYWCRKIRLDPYEQKYRKCEDSQEVNQIQLKKQKRGF